MTITEANAVNTVLRDLLERVRVEEEDAASPDDLWPVDPRLIEASVALAAKANKVLSAGLTGDQVREALT